MNYRISLVYVYLLRVSSNFECNSEILSVSNTCGIINEINPTKQMVVAMMSNVGLDRPWMANTETIALVKISHMLIVCPIAANVISVNIVPMRKRYVIKV